MATSVDTLSIDFVFDTLRARMPPGDAVRLGRTCRAARAALRALADRVYSAFPPRLLGAQGLTGALAHRWGGAPPPGEVDEALAGAARGRHFDLVRGILCGGGGGPSHAAVRDALLFACHAGELDIARLVWPRAAAPVCGDCRQGILLDAIKATEGLRRCAPVVTWAASQLLRRDLEHLRL